MSILPLRRKFTLPPPVGQPDPLIIDESGAFDQMQQQQPPDVAAMPDAPVDDGVRLPARPVDTTQTQRLLDQIAAMQQKIDKPTPLWRQIAAAALGATRHGRAAVPFVSGDAQRQQAMDSLPLYQAAAQAEMAKQRAEMQAEEDASQQNLRNLQGESALASRDYKNRQRAKLDEPKPPEPPTPRTRRPDEAVYTVGQDGKYNEISGATPKPDTKETPTEARERRAKEWFEMYGEDPKKSREGRAYVLTNRIPNPQQPQQPREGDINRAERTKVSKLAGSILIKHGEDVDAAMKEAMSDPSIPDEMRIPVTREIKSLKERKPDDAFGLDGITFPGDAPAAAPAPKSAPAPTPKPQSAPSGKTVSRDELVRTAKAQGKDPEAAIQLAIQKGYKVI